MDPVWVLPSAFSTVSLLVPTQSPEEAHDLCGEAAENLLPPPCPSAPVSAP